MAKQELSLPFDGGLLRKHRERGGYLQSDLAQRCEELGHKVDRSRISQLENGVYKPLPPLLSVLARALNVEIDDLLAPDEELTEKSS